MKRRELITLRLPKLSRRLLDAGETVVGSRPVKAAGAPEGLGLDAPKRRLQWIELCSGLKKSEAEALFRVIPFLAPALGEFRFAELRLPKEPVLIFAL